MEMKRSGIWISSAIAAGAGLVFVLPDSWFMPVFFISICATLLLGVISRVKVKENRPVDPFVYLAASILKLPDRPFAKVRDGWALRSFAVLAAFVVSLAISVILRANI